MQSNYKSIGDFIRLVDERNTGLHITNLIGVSISKQFIKSVANVIGADMENYKIIRRYQFACSIMQVRRDKKMPVALYTKDEPAIISQAYPIFEILDTDELLPEYLMMWFTRSEFDRQACFHAVGGVRGSLEWEDFCNMSLPIPSPEKQLEIVKEYNVIQNRIKLNNQLISKLEETAQAIYKQWFVDFEFNKKKKVSLSNYLLTNPKLAIAKNKVCSYIEMNDLDTSSMRIKGIIKRSYIGGAKFQNNDTLLARITPCLENGKTAFVNILTDNEIAGGSTEFIVMRARKNVSPYWVYCLARDEKFREFAISSMIGSSGRQRVHESYLREYLLMEIDFQVMEKFDKIMKPVFDMVKQKSKEISLLYTIKTLLYSKMSKVEMEKELA